MAKNSIKAVPAVTQYKEPEARKGGPFDDYEVQSALNTLTKAEKIKKNSALMRACRRLAKQQLADLQKTTANL